MKEILFCLGFSFFISLYIFPQDIQDVKRLEKGELAPYRGVLLPDHEYKKLYEAYQTMEAMKPLDKNLQFQVVKLQELIQLKDEEIQFLKTKYDLERSLSMELQKNLTACDFKVKALTISTSVGFSISLAELIGIGVFALLYYSMTANR